MKKSVVWMRLLSVVLFSELAVAEVDMLGNGEGVQAEVTHAIKNTKVATLVTSCDSPVKGNDGLTWDGEYLWIADYDTRRAYRIDPSTCKSVSDIPLPGTYPNGLGWDGTSLWFADSGDDKIYKIDPKDGNILSSFASPGVCPSGLTYNGSHLWNNDTNCKSIECTPDKTYKLTTGGSITLEFSAIADYPTGLAWDGTNLWLSDNSTNTIYKVNPADLSVLDSFPAPGAYPNDLAWDGRYLWVIDNGTDKIYKYDVGTPNCSDSDKDGVPDQWDRCPHTPVNAVTDKYGCKAKEKVVIVPL